jgi:Ni/Fe-hydrogenase subunit HybB-like protein
MSADAREASLRPFGKPSPAWWLVVAGLAGVVGVGIVAWVVQLRGGMGVSGFNDHAFWAIDIANVVTFIGVSYGGAVVSAILRLTGATWRAPLTRLAEGTAVITVLIGSALIIPHIGRPDRLYELVTQPNLAAPVFWDFIAVMTYTAASVVFFALPLVPDMAILSEGHSGELGRGRRTLYAVISRGWVGGPEQRRVLSGALGLVSIMIIPLAVSVHSVLAWAMATTSRPWWHESIWAPQFVVAALYSGVALVILVVAGFRRGYHLEAFITPRHFVRLGFILAVFATTYLYLTFADILPGAYVGEHGVAAVFGELLVGSMAPWFWLFVIAGGVLPLLLVALPWTRNIWGMVAAAALVVPMMWLKRMLMVVAPGNYDTMTGAFGNYNFTWVPIAVTLAALAAIPLLLMLLFRVVPLLSIDEIEEIEELEEAANAAAAAAYQGSGRTGHKETGEPAGHSEPEGEPQPVGARARAHRVAGVAGAATLMLLVALLGTLSVGAAPHADAATAPTGPPKITITGIEGDGAVQLTAKVTDAAGKPVAKADVKFLLTTTVFGPRAVPLGTVATDTTGTARLLIGTDTKRYRPTTTGPQEFVASYTADGQEPVEFATNVDVTAAKPAYTPGPPKPLAAVGHALAKALFFIVATVWILLIAQVVRVRRVCRPRRTVTVSNA